MRVGLAAPAAPVIVKRPLWESLVAATLATEFVPHPNVSPTPVVSKGVPVIEAEPNTCFTPAPENARLGPRLFPPRSLRMAVVLSMKTAQPGQPPFKL